MTTCSRPHAPAEARIWSAVQRERSLLLSIARGRLIDASVAEDVVHDAAVQAVGRLCQHPVETELEARAQLAQHVRWRAGEVNRQRRRVEPCSAPAERPGHGRVEPRDCDGSLALRQALSGLPVSQLTTLTLRYGAGMSWDEVGRQTGCTWKQAARRGARALDGLRRRLA